MGKKDYIEKITNKIFDTKIKEALQQEVEYHIDEKEMFFEEIGYDNIAAEEKAVEAMGDVDTVAEQFGKIHNEFYNPFFDIVFLVLWGAALFAIYYALNEYIFGNSAGISLLLCGVCISLLIPLGYIALNLKRKKLVPTLLSVVGIGLSGAFNYFIFNELYQRTGGKFSNLCNFILYSKTSSTTLSVDFRKIYIAIAVISALLLIGVIISLNFIIKVKFLRNKRIDNKFRKAGVKIYKYFFVLFVAFSILFGVKYFIDIDNFRNEYVKAYETVFEISEKCSSFKDVQKFVESCGFDFEEKKNADGDITGYEYENNLTSLSISKYEIEDNEYEEDDDLPDLGPEFETLSNIQEMLEALGGLYDDEYKKVNTLYSVSLKLNTLNFGKTYTSLTLKPYIMTEDEQDRYYKILPDKLTNKERFDIYRDILPVDLNVEYTDSALYPAKYEYGYVIGKNNYFHHESNNVSVESEKGENFQKRKSEIIDIIKKNRKASREKIAQLTKTKIKMPKYTRAEYKKIADKKLKKITSNFEFKEEAIDELYDTAIRFYIDDELYFTLDKSPYTSVIFNGEQKSFDFANLNGKGSEFDYITPVFSKVKVNNGYFDKKGYFYKSCDYTPYYTAQGEKFYYYRKTIEPETKGTGNTYEYYLTNYDGVFYDESRCFINEDGYLYIDSQYQLKQVEGEFYYQSSDGKKYYRPFYTSWNEKGELIFADKNDTAKYMRLFGDNKYGK